MRFRYLLVLLAFSSLPLTSGCYWWRHGCCRSGCCTPCCSPCCDTCCGYAPVQGPIPPLANPVPSPHVPFAGNR